MNSYTASPFYIHSLDLIRKKRGLTQRSKHKAIILSTIYQSPGITRKELIAKLGIRAGTVTDIIQVLAEKGVVLESPAATQKDRGRPEIPLSINPDRWFAISIFCVSMNLHAILVNGLDEEIDQETVRIPRSADNTDFESFIISLVQKLYERNTLKGDMLGISLSVPGIVNSLKKTWIFSARWPWLRELSLGGIEHRLNMPISIRRQLDVQLSCSMIKDSSLTKGNVLLFHWGYGIGGSYATNGNIVKSNTGVFCQIGHVSVDPNSKKPCICGKIGCLETDAALWALEPEIERSHALKIEDELACRDFLKANSITDQVYFRQALNSVAHALSRLQAILVPDHILLYGAFIENDEVFDSLISKTKQLSPPFIAETIQFKRISMESLWDPRGITAGLFMEALAEVCRVTNDFEQAELPVHV